MSLPTFKDLSDLEEDKRIQMIGDAASSGMVVGFITDDTPGKADRYVAKLKAKFPKIAVVRRFNGPARGTVTVKIQLAKENQPCPQQN